MARDIASELPGTTLQRLNRPLGANPPALPLAPCVIATGNRNKRISDEIVLKGAVADEDLTVAGSSPYTATLANRAVRDTGLMVLSRLIAGNTTTLNAGRGQWSINSAFVLGSAAGPFDLSTNNAFAIDIDGASYTMTIRAPLASTASVITGTTTQTLTVASGHRARVGDVATVTGHDAGHNNTLTVTATTATTVVLTGTGLTAGTSADTSGTITFATQVTEHQIDVTSTFSNIAAATRSEVATAINLGLVAALGADYAAAASDATTGLRIESQSEGSDSDVRIYAAFAQNAATVLFGSATLDADTVITIADSVGSVAGSTYSITYIAAVDSSDSLAQTPTAVRGLGSFPGGTNYRLGTDYTLSGAVVTWTPAVAVLTGTAATPADINPNDTFGLGLDRGTLFDVDLAGRAFQPIGYATIASPDTAALSDVVTNINAVSALMMGPRYQGVATAPTVNGSVVLRISGVRTGESGAVVVRATTESQQTALTELFGLDVDMAEATGTGRVPAAGARVYATYDYARPSSEYNIPYVWTDYEEALAHIGGPSVEVAGFNPLGVGLEICKRIGAAVVVTVQVDDTTIAGSPTFPEIQDALDEAQIERLATEVCIVGEAAASRVDAQTALVSHVEGAMAPEVNHPRRAYSGGASSMAIGNRDTEGSLLFAPARTFQVDPEAQSRGRFFWAVGPKRAAEAVEMDVRLDDGTTTRLQLDHSYVALAAAAQRSTLPSSSSSLTNRGVDGVFVVPPKVDSWNSRELRQLYAGGCLILASDGGSLSWVEGITTEKAGAAEVAWEVDSGTVQDDILREKITVAMDRGLRGIVPVSLEGFILTVQFLLKTTIESLIGAGEAGEYVNSQLQSRPLDINTDLRVKFSRVDPRIVYFHYSANRRYPVTKFVGTYTPDVNLLSALAAQA